MKITVLQWLQEEKLLLNEKLAEKEENPAVKRKAELNAREDDRFVKNLQSSTRLAICIPFSKLIFKN
jgi:hypothetical protein